MKFTSLLQPFHATSIHSGVFVGSLDNGFLRPMNEIYLTLTWCASSLYACVKDLGFGTCMEGLGFGTCMEGLGLMRDLGVSGFRV